jgi:SdrD B-like domain
MGTAGCCPRDFARQLLLASATGLILAFSHCAGAQTVVTTTSNVSTPSAGTASTSTYQDKIMEGVVSDDAQDQAVNTYNSTGWPRGYSLETVWDQRRSVAQRSSSLGLKASGYIDTPDYGSISAQASLQNAGGDMRTQSSYIVRQIGMPFDGGWRADNTLGMVNLPAIDLARGSLRLSVPTPGMRGVTTQWQQTQGLSLTAALGQAGRFEGYPVAGFEVAQGRYQMIGVQKQQRTNDGLWQWGVMAAQAKNVPSGLAATGNGLLDAQAAYTAARREWAVAGAPPSFMQANAVTGHNNGQDVLGATNPKASGLWLDGGFGQGAHMHNWGAFSLQPGLAWLDLPLASDLQGGYWRHNWRTRQWSVESGLELLDSVSGTLPKGYFANSNVRYQYSSDTSFGGAVTVRRYGVQAQSALLYTQFANPVGNARLQAEAASADTGERQYKLQVDQDWTMVQGMRLSTALSADRERSRSAQGLVYKNGVGLALTADWTLGSNVTFNQSFQARRSSDASQYTLNAGLGWRFAPRWSLQARVYAISGSTQATALAQSPLTPPGESTTRTNDKGVFVSLRYQEDAGRALAPIGGAPGSAAGRLQGVVFLDDNKNGKRDATERGATNVTVLLDGRFATQTDAQGRYDFSYIVAGPHVLTVIGDNLPLPWSLQKDGRTEVRVYTRETTTVDIGALKP